MEKIAWRVVLALGLAGILIGTPWAFLAWRSYDDLSRQWVAASAEATANRDACEKSAFDQPAKDSCLDKWLYENSSNKWMFESLRRSGDGITRGLLAAVVLPISLFSLYFLLRWILTGRWRDKPNPA